MFLYRAEKPESLNTIAWLRHTIPFVACKRGEERRAFPVRLAEHLALVHRGF